jgi:transketolase
MHTKELGEKARLIRRHIVEMVHAASTGHMGGPLGMADIYAALYFKILRHNPHDPLWSERDRLILSCGHTCPVRYAAMAEAGYFSVDELITLRKFGSRLQGHPSRVDMPELETSSGPLGQGLSQAIGMALIAKQRSYTWRTYCILSDGEHQEGQTWEAVMMAGAYRLKNLTTILDRNFIQIDGPTESVMPLEPLADKYRAFGWHVIEINGHDIDAVIAACNEAGQQTQPTCIIATTTPGKGVSFMEHDYTWHGKAPNDQETAAALKQLEAYD